ncbi:hypothetical protein BDV32DRAFT_118789 [Aspergillus pseudonomiae]|nr:hypothetical protein BDV32DRAFT_118789 [Aspergillus pseudonomiae]
MLIRSCTELGYFDQLNFFVITPMTTRWVALFIISIWTSRCICQLNICFGKQITNPIKE